MIRVRFIRLQVFDDPDLCRRTMSRSSPNGSGHRYTRYVISIPSERSLNFWSWSITSPSSLTVLEDHSYNSLVRSLFIALL